MDQIKDTAALKAEAQKWATRHMEEHAPSFLTGLREDVDKRVYRAVHAHLAFAYVKGFSVAKGVK